MSRCQNLASGPELNYGAREGLRTPHCLPFTRKAEEEEEEEGEEQAGVAELDGDADVDMGRMVSED